MFLIIFGSTLYILSIVKQWFEAYGNTIWHLTRILLFIKNCQYVCDTVRCQN